MKIKKNQILSLDKYISKKLYNKKSGYYMMSNPFGTGGDYITAPNISILFSEMIAIWIILFWEKLKCPSSFNLIELGAGNGEMILQIMKTFEKFPSINNACKINILEKSFYLKKIQKKKLKGKNIKWLKNLSEISNNQNIFIANEFFDTLPIKQYLKKKTKWYERNVELSKNSKPKFKDILVNMKKIEKIIGFKISYQQDFIEYSPLAIEYLKVISKKININNGGLLIIDYGYWNKKMKNTLKSISNHKFINVLNDLKKFDISHNLNFKLYEKIFKKLNLKISEKTNQKKFLTNLGILKRAEIISSNLTFSKKADIYYRIKRLIDKKLMGELFKVIFATKKNINFTTNSLN